PGGAHRRARVRARGRPSAARSSGRRRAARGTLRSVVRGARTWAGGCRSGRGGSKAATAGAGRGERLPRAQGPRQAVADEPARDQNGSFIPGGIGMPAVALAILSLDAASILLEASLKAAATRSSAISGSESTLGSMRTLRHSFV